MKDIWLVVLVTPPANNPYRADFFPRQFWYKKDALKLKTIIEEKGGVATVIKEVNNGFNRGKKSNT